MSVLLCLRSIPALPRGPASSSSSSNIHQKTFFPPSFSRNLSIRSHSLHHFVVLFSFVFGWTNFLERIELQTLLHWFMHDSEEAPISCPAESPCLPLILFLLCPSSTSWSVSVTCPWAFLWRSVFRKLTTSNGKLIRVQAGWLWVGGRRCLSDVSFLPSAWWQDKKH